MIETLNVEQRHVSETMADSYHKCGRGDGIEQTPKTYGPHLSTLCITQVQMVRLSRAEKVGSMLPQRERIRLIFAD